MSTRHFRRVCSWLALVVGIAMLASVSFGQSIPLRGPPLNQRPPNVVITDTTGSVVFSIQQHVQLMPMQPIRGPLNNGTLLPEFVYDIPPATSGGGGIGGGFGGAGGFGGFGGGGF